MSILFVIGTTIMFSTLGYTILMLYLCMKSFHSIIFPIINVHPRNGTNLDTRYNTHSFHYGHYNHVLYIRIHDIDAFDLQEKLFFPPFSLQLMFIHELRQAWILITISMLFVMGTTIMFSTLGNTMLMLWICKKSFSFQHFPNN